MQVDHTAYTVSTVGQDGFLNILPVYLDHVLFPTITDEGVCERARALARS